MKRNTSGWNDGTIQIHRSEIDAYQKRIAELEAELIKVKECHVSTIELSRDLSSANRALVVQIETIRAERDQLAASLREKESFLLNYDHAMKIEREDFRAQMAESAGKIEALDARLETARKVRQKVLADVKHWLLTSTNIAGASILLFSREFGLEE